MRTLSNITFHPQVRQALEHMLASQKIPQVLLFSGPEGVGKKSMAKAFIAELLGMSERDLHRIEIGSHPDIKEYAPETKSGGYAMQQIKHFIEENAFPPLEAERRFFLFHDAHQLMDIHANALLKTLEELPPYALVILFTTHTHQIVDTVLSRSVVFQFFPLSDEEIINALSEKSDEPKEKLSLIARRSEGSFSQSLEQLQTDSLETKMLEVLSAYFQDRLDLGYGKLEELQELIEAESKESGDREKIFVRLLDLAFYWVRDVHLLSTCEESDCLYFPEKRGLLLALAKKGALSLELAKLFQIEAIEAFERHLKPKVILQQLLIRYRGESILATRAES